MQKPRLAVLIPVYRSQEGLDRSLASLGRAEGEFDVVIVDDGSEVPIRCPHRLEATFQIRLYRLERNRGIAGALNHGLANIMAGGYLYVARLDTGDTVSPERFTRQIDFLRANPDCAVVSSFVDFVDRSERPLYQFRSPCTHKKIVRRLHVNNCLIHPSAMIRTAVIKDVGIYREDVPGAEDYEIFLRIGRRYELAVLPEVLTRCEYSKTGLSIGGRRQQLRERLKLQIRYFDPMSALSFYGVARTLSAMLTPHQAVLGLKRILNARVP